MNATETMPSAKRRQRVKLWNELDYDYHEQINGKEYHIPAKKFIELPRHEASVLQGSHPGYKPNPLWNLKTGKHGIIKRLRIEMPKDYYEPAEYRCNMCGKQFGTQGDLSAHLLECNVDGAAKLYGKKEEELKETQKVLEKTIESVYCPACLLLGKTTKFNDKSKLMVHLVGHKELTTEQKDAMIVAINEDKGE